MPAYFETTNRLIIPRWREYDIYSLSKEHLPSLIKSESNSWTDSPFIKRKVIEWEREKTLETAWELVNSSFLLDQGEPVNTAAKLLLDTMPGIGPILRNSLKEILNDPLPEEINNEGDVPLNGLRHTIGGKIRRLRKRLLIQPRNELYWIEMARLYSILGLFIKAQNCVTVALDLSKNTNRYILRSASRFFYHLGDYERAQQIIKRSPYINADPWLLSAEISYAIKQERRSRNVKRAMELVQSTRYSAEALTELNGTLGTLELINGSNRQAKKLTIQSLKAPNDNSLAQAEWISRQVNGIPVEQWLDNVELAFEAKAFDALYSRRFDDAVKEGIQWFLDQPFSKRPAHFVSYICTVFTREFDTAIEICELALKSNPASFPTINNLAFAYASIGRISDAWNTLRTLLSHVTDDRSRIIYEATSAYTLFKQGMNKEGREKYEDAIRLAKEKGYRDLQILASAYLIREQYFTGEIPLDLAAQYLHDLLAKARNFDVNLQLSIILQSMLTVDTD